MKAIINANVVLTDEILNDATIMIEDGNIFAVGKNLNLPENTEVIDADGMWVGPGFVDIHIHGDGTSCRWNSNPEQVAKHHLRHGSTTMVATMSYGQTPESLIKVTTDIQNKLDDGLMPNVYSISFEGPYKIGRAHV